MPELMGSFDPATKLPAEFLALPAQIYADDKHWIPEDNDSLCQQFSKANPWFDEGRCWLGVIPGKARVAGFFNQQMIDGEPAAFFGFWEGIDDVAAHRQLFSKLEDWARTQGATRLYGPINFTTFNPYRLRLDSFDRAPFPGEPWNPDYYPALLEKLGFGIRYRYLSTFADTASVVAGVKSDYLRVKPKLEQLVSLEAMTADFWMNNLDELYGFVDQVFGGNFAYTGISRSSFEAACGHPFADKFCPQSSVLARAKDGRIAGFFLVYPDYAPLLQQGASTRTRNSDVKYATHFSQLPAPRRGLAKTGGVHPDFRAHGLFTAMSCELSLRAEGIYEELAGTLVREDNNSRQFALRHGTASQHTYGLFQIAL